MWLRFTGYVRRLAPTRLASLVLNSHGGHAAAINMSASTEYAAADRRRRRRRLFSANKMQREEKSKRCGGSISDHVLERFRFVHLELQRGFRSLSDRQGRTPLLQKPSRARMKPHDMHVS